MLTIRCLPSLPSSTRSRQYESAYPSRVPNIKNQTTLVSDPLPSVIVVDSLYGSWAPAERGPQSDPTLQAYLAAEHERMLNRIRCANGPPSSLPVPAGLQPHVRFVYFGLGRQCTLQENQAYELLRHKVLRDAKLLAQRFVRSCAWAT